MSTEPTRAHYSANWHSEISQDRAELDARSESPESPRPPAVATPKPQAPSVSGTETGTGVLNRHGGAQAGDIEHGRRIAMTAMDLAEARYRHEHGQPHRHEHCEACAREAVAEAARPVHYREAAASLRAIADADEKADPPIGGEIDYLRGWRHAANRLESVARDLEDEGDHVTTSPQGMTDEELQAFCDAAPNRIDSSLWTHLDWSLWGTGLGDTFREPLASTMVAAIPADVRAHAEMVMAEWLKFRGVESPAQTNAELRAELAAIGRMLASIPEADEPESVKDKAWAALNAITKRNNDLRADNTALAAELAAVGTPVPDLVLTPEGFEFEGQLMKVMNLTTSDRGTEQVEASIRMVTMVEWRRRREAAGLPAALGETGGTNDRS